MDKILAGILGILIVFALPGSALAAVLSLSPSGGALNRGCSYSIAVNLDTGGTNTDGTDAIIKYDPSKITVTSVTPGTIYPDYPTSNPNNSTGTVTISGLASVSSPVSGSGKLATLNVNVNSGAANGTTTQMNFEFDPNNKEDTTDSNVVQTATVVDILESVTNGNYTIGTGSCSGTGTPTTTQIITTSQGATTIIDQGTPSGQTIDIITGGPSGITDNTVILSVAGGFLAILGVLGLALL